jgi:hypothetical protein
MRFYNPTLILGAIVAVTPMVMAQNYVATPPPPAPAAGNSGQLQQLPPLEQLLAPIALYPDPLIALILPAAAFPNQIQAVAANLNGADDPSFDPSIQGLAHYPDIVNWLNANLDWTQQLGGAFASSPADVMNAIQSLRQRARAAGTLVPSNYEQVVVDAGNQIEILPVQPEAVSIPTYDPSVVYWAPPPGYSGSYFSWSEPYPLGPWVTYDFDWYGHALWYGDWYTYRRSQGGWNHPIDGAQVNFSVAIGRGRPYRAPANAPGSPVSHGFFSHNDHIVQPRAGSRGGPSPAVARGGPAADSRREEAGRDRPAVQTRPEAPRAEERPAASNENQSREQPHAEVRSVPNSPAPAHPVPVRPETPHPVPDHNAPAHPVVKAPPHPPAPHPAEEHHDAAPDDHHDH